jgi:hypothetical protein
LKNCKPGDCLIQIPTTSIDDLHRSIDWSAANVNDEVNQLLQKTALRLLLNYQRDGDQALGVYNDKHDPTQVPQQFSYMVSYSKVLPQLSACRISTNILWPIRTRSLQASTIPFTGLR